MVYTIIPVTVLFTCTSSYAIIQQGLQIGDNTFVSTVLATIRATVYITYITRDIDIHHVIMIDENAARCCLHDATYPSTTLKTKMTCKFLYLFFLMLLPLIQQKEAEPSNSQI